MIAIRRRFSLFIWYVLLATCLALWGRQTSATPTISSSQTSSAIAITSDGATLLVVNPDSNSMTLVDVASLEVIEELVVGVDPRTVALNDARGLAYVANRGSDSISVINLFLQRVISEVKVGDRPYGIVVSPDGRYVCVAEQGIDRITVLETRNLTPVQQIQTVGRPSGLAFSPDGRTLYATHLLSNTISVIQLRPCRVYLPLILKGSSAGLVTRSPLVPQSGLFHTKAVDALSLWSESNLVQSILITPDGKDAYIPHTGSRTSVYPLTFEDTVSPVVALLDLETGQKQPLALDVLDPPAVGLPFDLALNPDGTELWVVNAASNDISVINLAGPSLTAHIEVGDNPRGIVISPDGARAFVNNTLAGTVSVLDTTALTTTAVITVTDIPLPPVLLKGKQLFHSSDDPRMGQGQWISCNSCHFEGEHDGRTWTFTFAGPRNTTGLLGMIETYPLRWSGEWDESADAEYANRHENFGAGLIDGEMGCSAPPNQADCLPPYPPNQGRSADMDYLAAFLDSLTIPLSPGHAHGERLSAAEERGQALFITHNCSTCHPAPLYTDQQAHDVGTATPNEMIGPEYDTPSLRGLYDSMPYFHDGSAATLVDALTLPSPNNEHDLRGLVSESEMADLIAFLLALPFE